jgi:hypothetical protein
MKGTQGLIIAAAFGIVGAFCNWFYIARMAEKMEKDAFVIIRGDARINPGDRFQEKHFDRVEIPRANVGSLVQTAVPWSERATAVGERAPKAYQGGELLLRQDLRTPAHRDAADMLAENEVLAWISVTSGNFVPEMLNPGDRVSFEVLQVPSGNSGGGTSREAQLGPTEMIGPFEVLSLGARRGELEVRRTAGASSGPEHVIGIRIREENGAREAKAERLFRALRLSGNKALGVVLHSAKTKT